MHNRVEIGNKRIGEGFPAFIIAEAGVNHNGELVLAEKLISEAANAGADCIKFQTFKADRVVTHRAPKAAYQLQVTDENESQYDMLKKIELSNDDHVHLKRYAEEKGIIFLSTPYNSEDIAILEEVNVPAYKIASGQIVEIAFLRHVAKTMKPIIVSTGMANIEEISAALDVVYDTGNRNVILMQCTTNYPSQIEDANIRVVPALKDRYKCLVGYSDHTIGNEATLAAVSLGACVIEKHFTIDKTLPGPDHSSSVEPGDLKDLIVQVRRVEMALGSSEKQPTAREIENAKGMRRSIVACRNIKAGDGIKKDDITFKRPASGIKPQLYDEIIGKKVKRDIGADEIITMEEVEW